MGSPGSRCRDGATCRENHLKYLYIIKTLPPHLQGFEPASGFSIPGAPALVVTMFNRP
jgi:hypothetical protein